MSLEITEDLIARQPPEARAVIRILLAKIAELEARLKQTPQNSSLPPSTQHPYAKPASPKNKSGRKRDGQPGLLRHQRFDFREVPDLVPQWLRVAAGERFAAAAARRGA